MFWCKGWVLYIMKGENLLWYTMLNTWTTIIYQVKCYFRSGQACHCCTVGSYAGAGCTQEW